MLEKWLYVHFKDVKCVLVTLVRKGVIAVNFVEFYLRMVSWGSDVKAETSFIREQPCRSKLVKEVRDDNGDTSLSRWQNDRFKLVREVRNDRGDTLRSEPHHRRFRLVREVRVDRGETLLNW